MHFSIPDTQELHDDNSSTYKSFNVHVNGAFHCSVRYKQLSYFHDLLKKEFGVAKLPPFPPKKLLQLTPAQLEERRSHIEKYVQLISQDPVIGKSEIFNGFLLKAQQETSGVKDEEVSLQVFLMNGQSLNLQVQSSDQTEDVQEVACSRLGLPDDLVYYFGLFLVRKENDGDSSIVRQLQIFESPYLSLQTANKTVVHRIVIRKAYWDGSIDDNLIDNNIALNLLYIQAVNDVERRWTEGPKDQLRHLDTLRQRNSKKEYLQHVRTLKHYGFLQFQPCITDYPKANTRTIVKIGHKELVLRVPSSQESTNDASFLITRMRCWRIGTSPNNDGSQQQDDSKQELSFEYLVSKNTLQWIVIKSEQAILMSMCLQSIVDELVAKKMSHKFKHPQDRQKSKLKSYLNRDMSHEALSRQTSMGSEESDEHGAINKAKDSVKRITDRIANSNKSANNSNPSPEAVTENNAFEDIGDEDL